MNWLLDKCEKDAKAILDALLKNGQVTVQNRMISIDDIATPDMSEF